MDIRLTLSQGLDRFPLDLDVSKTLLLFPAPTCRVAHFFTRVELQSHRRCFRLYGS